MHTFYRSIFLILSLLFLILLLWILRNLGQKINIEFECNIILRAKLGKSKTLRTFDTSQDETSWVTRDKSQNDLICIRFLLCQKRLTVLIITSGAAVYSHDFFGVLRIEQHSRLLLFKKTAKTRPLFMSQKMQNEITQYKIYLKRKSEGLYFFTYYGIWNSNKKVNWTPYFFEKNYHFTVNMFGSKSGHF